MPERLDPKTFHNSMRGQFAGHLYNAMVEDHTIWVVTGDLGYAMLDKIKADFPHRFINAGASEQGMMGAAVGLAMEHQRPFVYSITPFLLYRPFETIRNYINAEKVPVRLVGSGRDRDYSHDGLSHWAEDDRKILQVAFPAITGIWPDDKDQIESVVRAMATTDIPWYVNLKR